jgi:FkbH-like protein
VVKCVVLDLDNTLWGGVIGDDGLTGIRLGHLGDGEAFVAFQAYLKQLPARGILLAVCSKNERDAAMLPFTEHADMVLRMEDIAVFVANWDNKADNLRAIAKQLNIGLDSMVFLDDNPFERNLVRELVPEVIVPEMPEDPADYVRAISEWNLFETASFSELDEKRTELYRQRAESEAVRADFTSLTDYLRSLEMVATLGRFDAYNLPRIAQLLQRSNQFNLTTRRYSLAECEALMADESCYPFHLSLRDRLSDHGLIAVAVLKQTPGAVHVDSFLMSCRVLKRGVEELAIHTMVDYAKSVGKPLLTAEYIPTAKNAMVKDLYDGFGFERVETGEDGTVRYALRVDDWVPRTIFMQVEPR